MVSAIFFSSWVHPFLNMIINAEFISMYGAECEQSNIEKQILNSVEHFIHST